MDKVKTYFCSSCGDEYERDEAEGRQRKRLCASCLYIEKREAELLKEWELVHGYAVE